MALHRWASLDFHHRWKFIPSACKAVEGLDANGRGHTSGVGAGSGKGAKTGTIVLPLWASSSALPFAGVLLCFAQRHEATKIAAPPLSGFFFKNRPLAAPLTGETGLAAKALFFVTSCLCAKPILRRPGRRAPGFDPSARKLYGPRLRGDTHSHKQVYRPRKGDYAASFLRLAFLRSCGSRIALRRRMFAGVTSTISSSSI